MIVICTKCKAKFRVGDDRVGPRGAKVRCSRCQTVFFVHFESGGIDALGGSGVDPSGAPPAPGLDVELERPLAAGAAEAGGPPPSPGVDPFAAAGFGIALSPAPDPFAGAPAADPFAPAPAADPFASAPAADPFAPAPAADPFASDAPPDPFAAADALAPVSGPAAGPGGPRALTDIADLLGSIPASDPVAPAVVPPPLPPPLPAQAPADDGGLALEDRVTPPPLASRPPLDADALLGIHSRDGFGVSDPQAFGGYELGEGPADTPLGLATPEPEPAAPVAAPPEPEPAAPAPPPPAPRQPPMATSAPLADRVPQPRASRLRAVVVNAIAIVALLAVALAMLVVWREGRLEAGSLRPSAIRAALGAGGSGPLAAIEVRSGVYERERAPPLLFVRGKVVSRAAAPVRGVRISVEVIRDDAVIARGEALAGAIPTPEELYHANDAEAVAALSRTAGARAPAAVRPGEAVPFLVAIADHPSDLEGASLRVAVAEAGGRAR